MRYKLVNTRLDPKMLLFLGIIVIILNYLLWGAIGGFFLLVDIFIVGAFLYRVYDQIFVQYPVGLETEEEGLVLTYDRGLRRSLKYSNIKDVDVQWYENKDYGRLFVYLKSFRALKRPKEKVNGVIAVSRKDAKPLVQDIKKKAGIRETRKTGP